MDPERIIALARHQLPEYGTVGLHVERIDGGGSDRQYYRLRPELEPVIFCQYGPGTPENSRFAQHTDFLASHGVPVPRILARDPEERRLWIEDLGSSDLWSFREAHWQRVRRPLYEAALTAVERIHALRKADLSEHECPPLGPEFNEALYRWEQDYFFDNFVANFSTVTPAKAAHVRADPDLTQLIEELAALPRCLIHRDFQSQNVIVRDGKPLFIDYQGLRFGLGEYDLSALIYDPYVPMTRAEREELVEFCADRSPHADFRRRLGLCACQRLMQAIGAYGFLGLVKEKRGFLRHIRPAVTILRDVAVEQDFLHALAPVLSLNESAI